MEREIVQILKQRREKSNELQIKPDRTNAARNSVHGGQQRTENAPKAHRQVGQNVAGVGESRVPDGSADIPEGRWQTIPRIIDREAESRFLELDEKYRQENPRPQTFSEIQSWEKIRLLTVEHKIMEEIVYQLRL